MCKIILSIQLVFVGAANAKHNFIDQDHLFDRALKALGDLHIDMDNTTLGKPAQVATPSQAGQRLIPSLERRGSELRWVDRSAVQVASLGPRSANEMQKEQPASRPQNDRVLQLAIQPIQLALPVLFLLQEAVRISDIADRARNGGVPPKKSVRLRRTVLLNSLATVPWLLPNNQLPLSFLFAATLPSSFKSILPSIQYIAALGDPTASSGIGAKDWGIWRQDPGPRGVNLKNYNDLEASNGITEAGWKFNKEDWWLEEHGILMEQPDYPLPPGRYAVTGARLTNTILSIKEDGGWELENGKLYDVTHLPCRAARYTGGSPANAQQSDFPVTPGAAMPAVSGSNKQDYAVLFVTAIEKS